MQGRLVKRGLIFKCEGWVSGRGGRCREAADEEGGLRGEGGRGGGATSIDFLHRRFSSSEKPTSNFAPPAMASSFLIPRKNQRPDAALRISSPPIARDLTPFTATSCVSLSLQSHPHCQHPVSLPRGGPLSPHRTPAEKPSAGRPPTTIPLVPTSFAFPTMACSCLIPRKNRPPAASPRLKARRSLGNLTPFTATSCLPLTLPSHPHCQPPISLTPRV